MPDVIRKRNIYILLPVPTNKTQPKRTDVVDALIHCGLVALFDHVNIGSGTGLFVKLAAIT